MKSRYLIYIYLGGLCRDIAVEAYTASQALSLAKMQATPAELRAGTFEVIS